MSKLLKDTKQLYYDYMNYSEESGDKFYDNVKSDDKYSLSTAEKHFIKRYLSLVINSSIVSESTKAYLRYPAISSDRQTFQSIINSQKKDRKSKVYNYNTVIAMLNYDEKKLIKYFDEDMLEIIMKIKKVRKIDLSKYEGQLNIAIARFGKPNELVDELVLKVPLTELGGELTNQEFNKLLEIIKPFSKVAMKQLIETLPENYKQYLNYLLFVEEKGQLDRDRYTLLEKTLKDGYTPVELEEMKNKFQALEIKKPVVQSEESEIPKIEISSEEKQRRADNVEKEDSVDNSSNKLNKYDLFPNVEKETKPVEKEEKIEVKKNRLQFG